MNRNVITMIIAGLLIALLCPGCAQRKAIAKDTFLLNAQRGGTSVQATSEAVLAVQPFSIAPAYQGKGLAYRTDDDQYESDFYNEYFASPSAMVTEQTRDWLSESGVFAEVLLPVSSVKPTHVLEGHIKQIVADVRDKANKQAVLELSFFLLEQHNHNRTIRFQKTYSATQSLDGKTASACIVAMNQCLSEILGDLEKDLASNLSEK
jgi:cholesterol transport system auxiliary component